MSDVQYRLIRGSLTDGFEKAVFCQRIQRRSRLIQDEKWCFALKGTGGGDFLRLASGKFEPFISQYPGHLRIDSLRKMADFL